MERGWGGPLIVNAVEASAALGRRFRYATFVCGSKHILSSSNVGFGRKKIKTQAPKKRAVNFAMFYGVNLFDCPPPARPSPNGRYTNVYRAVLLTSRLPLF